MNLDFKKFNTGTLFLVRTPEVFPVGYADECFRDMKENLHFDYAALLETWNCIDGTVWISDKFPRSSLWQGEERDPLEECFAAAGIDKVSYTYIFCDWFKQPRYEKLLKYIRSVKDCDYMFA